MFAAVVLWQLAITGCVMVGGMAYNIEHCLPQERKTYESRSKSWSADTICQESILQQLAIFRFLKIKFILNYSLYIFP